MAVDANTVPVPIYDADLLDYIERAAPGHGVDPFVALSIVPLEGGLHGAVGDNGTSFGPWQLHVGGALPVGMTGDVARQWANSPQGVDYALDKMRVAIGSRNTGTNAIDSAVTNFERPANPAPEIAGATTNFFRLTAYQQAAPDIDLAEYNKAVHGTDKVTGKSASDAGSFDAGDAASAIGDALNPFKLLSKVWDVLGSPETWIRVGLGVAGLAMVIVGAYAAVGSPGGKV